ncbi:hypothetical protein [Corynebacterium cystitidis]|uniref:hypothetical protein n=1 Tax=Corynebacterium cystitidis TaxID=35757 RepID=UPI00211F36CD|nr:hypothetical protein [Corynebacterium cystitidis]
MAWTRHGDNELTHPAMARLLSATAPKDNPLEVDHVKWAASFGVFSLLASISGAHLTDGYVEMGMISRIAPGWETEVLDILEAAGLAKRIKTADPTRPEDPTPRWMIKLDLSDEEFVHIRKKDEVELDRRRARDSRDEDMMMTVRVRDGDQCRWCGRTVSWKSRRGYRRAQIDSLNNHEDSTPETLVVSCHRCNDLRGKGKELKLRPAPKHPYYTDHTIALVNGSDWGRDNAVRLEPSQTRLEFDSEQQQSGSQKQDTVSAASPEREKLSSGASAGKEQQEESFDDDPDDIPWWVIADDEETADMIRRAQQKTDSRDGGAPQTDASPAADPHVDQGDGGAPQTDASPAADPHVDQGDGGAPQTEASPAADPHVDQGDGGAPQTDASPAADPHVDQGDGGAPQTDASPAADPHVDQGDGGAPQTDASPAADPHVDQGDGGAPQQGNPTKDNETVKPSTDLGRQGHGPGCVGTGRDGTGREGTEPGRKSQRKRRRRGRRSGKEL